MILLHVAMDEYDSQFTLHLLHPRAVTKTEGMKGVILLQSYAVPFYSTMAHACVISKYEEADMAMQKETPRIMDKLLGLTRRWTSYNV